MSELHRVESGNSSGQENISCPYGQPPVKPGRGSRILLWIIIGVCAAFVLAFGGYAIFLTFAGNTAEQQESSSQTLEEAASSAQESGQVKNPIGTGTSEDFAGISLEEPSDETLSAPDLYRNTAASVAQLLIREDDGIDSTASAVVLTEDGYLLTTAHAIGYSRETALSAVLPGGKEKEALVVGYDSTADIAVLKINGSSLTPARFASEKTVGIGDWVYAVSAGSDSTGTEDRILTRGIISAKDRKLDYDGVSGIGFLQTDVSVGTGGSGSALVNAAGQVIGINISNRYLEGSYTGESYTIPVSQIRDIVKDVIRTGYVSGKTRLGISGVDLTRSEAKEYNVPQGVVIVEIMEDSVFSGTDEVQTGDIITSMDGEVVTSMSEVQQVLKKHRAGDKMVVELYRVADDGSGSRFTVSITLLADEGQTQK